MDFGKHFSTRRSAQREPIPGEDMVKNNAGGFGFQVDCWTQLERFLILGSECGTYYVGERALTVENAENVIKCLREDGPRTLKTIVDISQAGRAPKNDPALFALALCAGMGDEATRRLTFEVLPQVARIGTHLLRFTEFMKNFRGWGRAARRGVGNWFLEKEPEQLGYQFMKYAQRGGWSLRDLLRLSHPQAQTETQNALFKYIVSGEESELLPAQLLGAREITPAMALTAEGRARTIALITEHKLPREAIPNVFFDRPEIWEALLESMPMTAMIRNLGKMTDVGLIKPMSDAAKTVIERLGDEGRLQKARVHPINVLTALLTYQNGSGYKGKLTWNAVPQVVDALDGAFYGAFKFVEPTGKRILIGLDVSGSMGCPVNGIPFLDCRTAAAAMCMVTARTEANWHIMAFTNKFVKLNISPRQRLDDVVRTTDGLVFGATDCSLPMTWALKQKMPVDAFVIYTDNETWFGPIHPVQALNEYRQKMGIPARMLVNAMTATEFSIGARSGKGYGTIYRGIPNAVTDPNDSGMMDVAGLDSAAPKVMADFIRG